MTLETGANAHHGVSLDGRPFRSSRMAVEESWLDYNDHLNMAFYNVLFDRAVDEFVIATGLGPDYVKRTGSSFFCAETHTVYLQELAARAPVYVTVQVLGVDAKRLHVFEELYHAEEHFRSATLEQILLHVDMTAKRVTPWPDEVAGRLAAIAEAHAALPVKEQVGRVIGIPGISRTAG